jgi:CelD/BcsL family acetyltransferase involved in cellulose biosynthesis
VRTTELWLTEHACARGWLSIWLLRLDGRPVAMEYQLIADDCVYALRSDFDEAYTGVSPGSHLNRELLERLFARGSGTYYMGPGTNAYKWRWTEQYDTTYRLVAYSPAWIGRLLGVADRRLRPAIERLRRRWQAPAKQGEDA